MKYLSLISMGTAFAVLACRPGTQRDHQEVQTVSQDSANVVLYNEVMDVHDEIMPRMEDLYNLKKDAQGKLSDPGRLVQGEEEKLKKRIAEIDSVSDMMMDWMHEFNPPPDTANDENTRAYLESEMEKIRLVRQAMLETIGKEN